MNSSYSQNNMYLLCPKMWHLTYKEKYESEVQGSSLFFGTAIDSAVMDMLAGKTDFVKSFYDKWEFQFNFGKAVRILENDTITYSHKDFDADLLETKDYPKLEVWAKEFNLIPATATPTPEELVKLYKEASKAKANPYIKLTDDQFKYFNRCSWLSLKRKGKILINSFHQQFYPKIKKVIATQKRCKIEDAASGDSIVGYVDMIVELEGYDKPVILDLKTSSFLYDQEQLDLSPQLTLYAAMEAKNVGTDLVGYVILNKMIPKDEVGTCQSCGYNKSTRHKTCDNTLPTGSRCGGTWIETKVPNPQVQVLIDKKSPEQIEDLLMDMSNVILAMKNGIIYKNTNHCNDHFGGKCPFYNLCHKNDSTGLTKKK